MNSLARVPAAALLLTMFAACGGDSSDSGDTGATPDTTADTDAGAGDIDTADTDAGGDTAADADDGDDDIEDAAPDADVDAEVDAAPIEPIAIGPLSCVVGGVSTTVAPDTPAGLDLPIENAPDQGVQLDFLGREVLTETGLELSCGTEDIVPEGIIALAPPFTLTTDGAPRFVRRFFARHAFDTTLVPEGALPSSLRIYLQKPSGDVVEPLITNFQEDMERGLIRFEAELTGTWQLGVPEDAGVPRERLWHFRALSGVSMGGIGSSIIGFRHPDEFDIVAPLGGPVDWAYVTHYVLEAGLGGFTAAPDFAPPEPYDPDQEGEHAMHYEEWYFPTGEGTGGTFNREDYTEIFTDLILAAGNMITYRPDSPYAAPGMPLDELRRPWADRCPRHADQCPPADPSETFTIADGFFDDEYNPDGSLPVIAFCDGRGSRDHDIPFDRACDTDFDGIPDEANEGLLTDPCEQWVPIEFTLAVDRNGNGIRDIGEPVIRNAYEPFEDIGADGIASEDEEGYDAVRNPDPIGDDYDMVDNPLGTEGNWVWNEGEPYLDFGIDGVDGTPQYHDGGFDVGEGNGVFDYNPNLQRIFDELDPHRLWLGLTEEQRASTNIFLDAGIRDLFNFAVSTNQIAGLIQGTGANLRVYEDFWRVQDIEEDDRYDFSLVDYAALGENVYVRYGNIDASHEDVCFGDGKHVGTIPQIANRLLTMLGYITARFPNPDRTIVRAPFPISSGTFQVPAPTGGGTMRYSISFPPGYELTQCTDGRDNDGDGLKDGADPDCLHGADLTEGPGDFTRCNDGIDNDADGARDERDEDCLNGDGTSEWPPDSPHRTARYPVIYVMHGYGMAPDELQITALPFSGFMASGLWPKALVIFPDGECGEVLVTACEDDVDNDGDGLRDEDDPDCETSGGRSETGEFRTICTDGIDNDADGLIDAEDRGCVSPDWDNESDCREGNFYTDHVAYPDGIPGGPLYETRLFDLIDHIDASYPVREPEVLPDVR